MFAGCFQTGRLCMTSPCTDLRDGTVLPVRIRVTEIYVHLTDVCGSNEWRTFYHKTAMRQWTVSPITPAFSANMLPDSPPTPGGKLPHKPATWNLKCKWNEIQLKRNVKFNSTTAQKQTVSLTHEWAGDKHVDYASRGWRQRQGGLQRLHPED